MSKTSPGSGQEPEWSEYAPAKLNLSLHITGRRADGYHELESLVAFADVGDRVFAQPADRLSLRVIGPYAEHLVADEQNSVWRAALALRQAMGKNASGMGAALCLEKNLPVASGIGGGSADAAAALRLLNRLWNAGFSLEQLAEIGLPLGADVPVCVHGKSCLMRGIGEEIINLPKISQSFWVVLINPRVPVSTPDVFKAFRNGGEFTEPGEALQLVSAWQKNPEELLRHCHNGLQPFAIGLCPVIAEILERLSHQPETFLARMSGSGATCFGLCHDQRTAIALAEKAGQRWPEFWVTYAQLL